MDVRLKEINEQLIQAKEELILQREEYIGTFDNKISELITNLQEICRKIE
ncbi:MAG: hypothetical protein NY202_03690 [Mollicutes bacterium UO1]